MQNCLNCYYHLFLSFENWCAHPGHTCKIKKAKAHCDDHIFHDFKGAFSRNKLSWDNMKKISAEKPKALLETHKIIEDGNAIHCLFCGKISYNRDDVREKYCGNCRRFHNDT